MQITGQVPEGAVEIRIVSDDAGGFVPGELTIDLGHTVAFINAHHDEHTATGSGFDTGVIASATLRRSHSTPPAGLPTPARFIP